jgi:hypothetical protein
MRPPSPTWELNYASDRRKHSHRCRCCDRIIQAGERVLMIRLRGFRGKKTWALHVVPCADVLHSREGGWTWRDAFEAWGTDHLIRTAWPNLPAHPMSQPGAVKAARAA